VKINLNTVLLLTGIAFVIFATVSWTRMTEVGQLIPPSRREMAPDFELVLVAAEDESVPSDTPVEPPPETPETPVEPAPTAPKESWRLSEQKGSIVFIIFWTSWSEDCVRGGGALAVTKKLHHIFAPEGVKIIGINNRQNKSAILKCIARLGLPYPILYDVEGVACDVFSVRGRPKDVPTCLAIDAQGRIAAHFIGFSKEFEEQVRAVLTALAAEGQAP